MIDEGYIKFACEWVEAAPPRAAEIAELIKWRNRLYVAGLVGHDAVHDVGFGNLSLRCPGSREFVISGTQTGHVEVAHAGHFTQVVDYDIAANRVVCRGPLCASSESLTHAAIYELDPEFLAVVHVHSRRLWQELAGEVPTTDAVVAYGTPAMASEFGRLYRETDWANARLAVMGGHADGLVSVGASMGEAAASILTAMEDSSD